MYGMYVPSGGVGAVGIQTPGIGGFGGVYVTGSRKPSSARSLMRSPATSSPVATPSSLAWPSGIVPSDWSYAGSRIVSF
jgi:hypothetical protein